MPIVTEGEHLALACFSPECLFSQVPGTENFGVLLAQPRAPA